MLNNIFDRIKLHFCKEKELCLNLYNIIGFVPGNIEYYKQALLHKSMYHRNEKGRHINNERLEFLGDAILDAMVGYIVYKHFPGKREGFLTNTRSKLVQRETLGKLADELGLTRLVLSNGCNNSHNSYMGGNAFEALVGAIYLDKGYNACMRFLEKRILTKMINIDKVAYKEVNFKSKLLEWGQKNRVNIEFRMLSTENEDKASPIFNSLAVIEGVECCQGTGYSKKEAQQLAAQQTLNLLRKKPQFVEKVFAAKTERTKMEEMPTTAVPSVEENSDFIIVHDIPSPGQPQAISTVSSNTYKNSRKSETTISSENSEKTSDNTSSSQGQAPNATPQSGAKGERRKQRTPRNSSKPVKEQLEEPSSEYDLSDISARPKTEEEIIAEAEAEAYAK